MVTTIISTDTTDRVILDGLDTVIVTSDGSITETDRAIYVTGDENTVSVFGEIIATGTFATIFVSAGIDNVITIGSSGVV
jgi:hypothetical protein